MCIFVSDIKILKNATPTISTFAELKFSITRNAAERLTMTILNECRATMTYIDFGPGISKFKVTPRTFGQIVKWIFQMFLSYRHIYIITMRVRQFIN